jgi:N-acetylglucosaminyl-diphospho-decaprenol L-rhamnosyltransferase
MSESTAAIDVSVIVVAWNVRELLRECLDSAMQCLQSSRLAWEILVVDNASSDGTCTMVRGKYPRVTLIAHKRNEGFTRGNNVGASAARGRYLVLLNPDTQAIPNAFAAMVRYMDVHADLGAVGPRMVFPDGRLQPSRRRFPTLWTGLLESTPLQQWFPHNRVLDRYYVTDQPDDEEQQVDWITGACMCIRRSTWEQVGPLDEGFFMYSEELDWCRRAKDLGWQVGYLPSATIIHHEGQSSTQVIPARHIYFQTSKVRYFRKYHGAFVAGFLRLFLLAAYLQQLGLETAKWLIGHRRSLRADRIRAYIGVLRSGLRTED